MCRLPPRGRIHSADNLAAEGMRLVQIDVLPFNRGKMLFESRINVRRGSGGGLKYAHMVDSKLYTILAVAGAAPFLACAILPLAGIESVEPFGRLDILAATYGLGIISFLAGVHWATALYRAAGTPFNLFVSSNVLFLAVWFAYVLAGINWVLLTQLLAFLLLLLIDYQLQRAGLISRHYFRVRALATALASVSLVLILLSL